MVAAAALLTPQVDNWQECYPVIIESFYDHAQASCDSNLKFLCDRNDPMMIMILI